MISYFCILVPYNEKGWPGGDTLRPRSGAAGRSHLMPEARGGDPEEPPMPEARAGGWEKHPEEQRLRRRRRA